MVMADGSRSPNMFAAGEIMAGNVLGKGYLAGIGMTIGSVFGRIAGTEAAKLVQSRGEPAQRPPAGSSSPMPTAPPGWPRPTG